jgi:DNA end-binding protein Ku
MIPALRWRRSARRILSETEIPRSVGCLREPTKGKKPRKAAAGQKDMLLPVSGKRTAKQETKKADKARSRKRA